MTARSAVLMKVHYWDDFTKRRLQHLLRKAGSSHVYVFVDETHGAVGPIEYERVIRVTEGDMERLGLLLYPPQNALWFNADYPLYYVYLQNGSYDYYLMCEHDAVLNVEIDEFVGAAAREQVDYVGFPIDEGFSAWHWRETCEGVYAPSQDLYNWLNCISLHSRRSVEFLFSRRMDLARRYKVGEIAKWPYTEAFIPTEMKNNGFVMRTLGRFGKVDRYTWWPPINEKELALFQDQAFLHPVLDEEKYVKSCIKGSSLPSYFMPNSELRRMLARCSWRYTVPNLLAASIQSRRWRSGLRRLKQRTFGRVISA